MFLPTRGMSLWKAWVDGQALGWNSPVRGPVHPSLVPLGDPGGLGWLDGFDELFVRCGLESNGAPEFAENGQLRYGLHGRIGNKPAHSCPCTWMARRASCRSWEWSKRLVFISSSCGWSRRSRLGSGQPRVVIRDVVENFSASPTGMQTAVSHQFRATSARGRLASGCPRPETRSAHAVGREQPAGLDELSGSGRRYGRAGVLSSRCRETRDIRRPCCCRTRPRTAA